MNKTLPFMLIFVVLGSGCTIPILNIEIPGLPDIPGFGGPTVVEYEHDIMVIKSLEAVPAEIDAGQTTKIIVYAENLGDVKLSGVKIELYDYCKGLFAIGDVKCGSDNTADKDNTECTIKEILPSQIVPIVWTLKQEGEVKLRTVCPPDGIKVLVNYKKETDSLTTISFISEEELERTLEQRTFRETNSYIVAGEGPIKPEIIVDDKQPIPVFSGARTVLALQIRNKGFGQPEPRTIKIIEVKGLEDGGLKTEDDCKIVKTEGNEYITLIGKESSKILCKLDLDLSGLDSIRKTATRHVEIKIRYRYIFTKSVMVTVNPKISG